MLAGTLQELLTLIRIPDAGTIDDRNAARSLPVLDLAFIDQLEHRLGNDPASLLAAAPAALGAEPTVEAARALLTRARLTIENPAPALAAAKLVCEPNSPCRLPDGAFPGYDHDEIPIDPWMRKFETMADGPAWVLTAVWAWGYRLTHAKPELPSHRSSPTEFRYALPRNGKGRTRLAIFSDWGTGYYHSRYIAKHIAELGANCAIHLGDV